MTVRALRVPLDRIEAGEAVLSAEASKYVTRVHRLGPGDRLVVFDPARAIEAEASILTTARAAARIRIEEPRPASLRPLGQVTLIQAVGKGDKLDAVIRDATELGATRIVPVFGDRSVARGVAEQRHERLCRIAVQAARQCGRGDVPVVEVPKPLGDAVGPFGHATDLLGLCLDPTGDPLGPRLSAMAHDAHIVLVVGPEGGLSGAELALCARAGFARVSLGALILRTETVCAAVLGAILVMRGLTPSRA